MNLRHLETFLAVVEHRGFRRAAAHLFLSQPAVSAQVRELERSIGALLFERTAHGITLTEAGESMVAPAQRIVHEALAMRRIARSAGLKGEVTIGMMPGGAGELTVPLLSELAARLPGVRVRVEPLPMTQWTPALLDEYDILLGREPFPWQGADETLLFSEEVYAGVPAGFAAADAVSLTIGEAVEQTFVHFGDDMPRELVDYWSLASLANGWRAQECGPAASGPIEIRDRVAAGYGIAIAPACVARSFVTSDIRYVPIGDMPRSEVKLLSRPGRGDAVAALHRESADIAERLTPLLLGSGPVSGEGAVPTGLWP